MSTPVHLPIAAQFSEFFSSQQQLTKKQQQNSHSNCRKRKTKKRKVEKTGPRVHPLALKKQTCHKPRKKKKEIAGKTWFKGVPLSWREKLATTKEQINWCFKRNKYFFQPIHQIGTLPPIQWHLKTQFKKSCNEDSIVHTHWSDHLELSMHSKSQKLVLPRIYMK